MPERYRKLTWPMAVGLLAAIGLAVWFTPEVPPTQSAPVVVKTEATAEVRRVEPYEGKLRVVQAAVREQPQSRLVVRAVASRQQAEQAGLLNMVELEQGGDRKRYLFFPGHVNYVDQKTGEVREADPTFGAQPDGTFAVAKANYGAVAPVFSDEPLRFTVDGETVTFAPLGMGTSTLLTVGHVAGVLEDTRVRYPDAFGSGIDYVIAAEPDELKKLVVFRVAPPFAEDFRVEFATSLQVEAVIRGRNTQLGQIHFRQPSVWDNGGQTQPITVNLTAGRLAKVLPVAFFSGAGRTPDAAPVQYPVTTDVSTSYYAGAGDGYVRYIKAFQSWATAHAETGDTDVTATYTNSTTTVGSESTSGGVKFYRVFLPISTSGIADNDEITAARLKVWITATNNIDLDGNSYIVAVQTTQAATTSLTGEDYDQCGSVTNPTAGSATLNLGDPPLILNAYNTITLNSTGEGWISKTGTTQLGLREGHDAVNDPLSGSGSSDITFSTSENTGTSQDPYLEVDTTAAAITKIVRTNDDGKEIFATSTEGLLVSGTFVGETNGNTTIEYVVFMDLDADNTPDTNETYVTNNCAGSAAWSSGNYTKQNASFTISDGQSPKTDSWECATTSFPEENGLYKIYVKWYDANGTIVATGTPTFQFCDQPTGTNSWWDTTMANRALIQMRAATFSDALINFPILVKATTTNQILDDIDTSGDDVRFLDEDTGNMLNFEKEFVDATTTKEAYWWVQVPKIATSTDCDYIMMYYDNTGTSTVATTTGVWRDDYYEAVWHFSETASTSRAVLDAGGTNAFSTTTFNTEGVGTIQGWVDGTNSNEGMYIGPWNDNETDGEVWNSSDHATTAQRPKLTVTCSGPTTYLLRDGEAGYTGTQDTYLDQANPTWNYGSSTTITVDESVGAGTNDDHALTLFDVSSIPTSCIVTSATLTLYTTNPMATAGLNFDIVEMQQAWVEGYKNGAAPDTNGGANWTSYGAGSWNTAGAEGYNSDVVATPYLDSTQFNHDEVNSLVASRLEKGQSKFGYAPKLAGTAGTGIGIPDSAGFDVTSYTLTGWYRRDGTGDGALMSVTQSLEPFIAKGYAEADTQAADIQFSVGYNRSGQATLASNWEDDRHASGNDWIHLGATTIANSVWRHFGFRLENKETANLYLDGFRNNTTSFPVNQGASTGGTMKLGIGTTYNTSAAADGGWNGYLDELRVYKVALATTTASNESPWLRAEWFTADNGMVEWGTEATATAQALSVTASTTVLAFSDLNYSFSAQTSTVANAVQGSVKVVGGAGTWTLNLNCNANSENCYWYGPGTRSYSFQDGVSPTAGYDGTEDVNIKADGATTNYNGDTVNCVDYNGDGCQTPATGIHRMLMQWDISSISTDCTVSSASITVDNNVANGGSIHRFGVQALRRNWGETTATWNTYDGTNNWTTAGAGDTSDDRYATDLMNGNSDGGWGRDVLGTLTFDFDGDGVAQIQSWIDGTVANNGIIIADNDTGDTNAFIWQTQTYATAASRPRLTVHCKKNSFRSRGGVSPSDVPSTTGILCITDPLACNVDGGGACTGVTLTAVGCIGTASTKTMATGSSAASTYWLKEADWAQGVPGGTSAGVYTTTITWDLQ